MQSFTTRSTKYKAKWSITGGGINTLLNRGAVKSVQRGYVSISTSGGGTSQHINISAVDPNKAIVAVSSEMTNSGDVVAEVVAYNLTSTGFQIKARHNFGASSQKLGIFASWQVIEFY